MTERLSKGRLVRFGYAMTMRGDWISDLWAPIWFRWWCPYPVIADYSARACVASGDCGCDASRRSGRRE